MRNLIFFLALPLLACGSPAPTGTQQCGAGGACPSGTECVAGYCYAPGTAPDMATQPTPDLATQPTPDMATQPTPDVAAPGQCVFDVNVFGDNCVFAP